MPADRPTHQSSLNPSFPFDRRASSLSASSSSSSSPSLHPSAAPSPSSTLESDYPDTPPSFTTRIPAHGFPSQQQQQQQHQFPRPRTNSSFFPPTPQQQQHHHQQHRQTGSAAGRVGGDGFPRPRELSVGYDPGGGRGERMVEVFEGGGGGAGHFSTSSAFSPQDLVIYVSRSDMLFTFICPLLTFSGRRFRRVPLSSTVSKVHSHSPFLSLSPPLQEHQQPLSSNPTSTPQSLRLLHSTQTIKVHLSLSLHSVLHKTRFKCGRPSRREGELDFLSFRSFFFSASLHRKLMKLHCELYADDHPLPSEHFRCLLRLSIAQQLRRTASDGELRRLVPSFPVSHPFAT